MGKLTLFALRAVIAVLLAGSVFGQTVMVALLGADLDESPLADRSIPILVITVLGIVAAQAVLVCVWRLAAMVRRGTVFSPDAFRYVHVVIGAFTAAAVLVFALGVVLAPGEAPSRRASCCCSAGCRSRSSESRSSSWSCGCCSLRPWRGTSRRPGCGPSWRR